MSRHSIVYFLLPGVLAAFLTGPVAPARANGIAVAQQQLTARKALIKRLFKPGLNKALPHSYPIAGNNYVSQQEYQDLANGVKELLRRYPPDKYYFIGLGRDPAPVIAFLQNLGEKDIAANLPGTSNIGWNGRVGDGVVAQHIEAAIPKEILNGERQLVILDVTSTGKTPAIFGPYFDRYLAGKGKQPTVKLAFSWQNVKAGQYGHGLSDWINTSAWADFRNYFTGKYEGNWTPQGGGVGIAEHQRHSMDTGAPPTQTSPNYAAFRAALRERMEQDHELDEFLLKHTKDSLEAESPEALAKRIAEEKAALAAQVKAERHEKAKLLVATRATPSLLNKELTTIVDKMGPRTEGHDKGPYLSPNAEELNGWLGKSIKEHADAAKLVFSFAKAGPNRLIGHFMDEVERARSQDKIRNRDYRRLMGHALSAATMDQAMVNGLLARFAASGHFRREIIEEANYYLNYHARKQRPETANMAANYQAFIQHLPASTQQEIQQVLKASAEAGE